MNEDYEAAKQLAERRGLCVKEYASYYLLDGSKAIASFRDARGITEYLLEHPNLKK